MFTQNHCMGDGYTTTEVQLSRFEPEACNSSDFIGLLLPSLMKSQLQCSVQNWQSFFNLHAQYKAKYRNNCKLASIRCHQKMQKYNLLIWINIFTVKKIEYSYSNLPELSLILFLDLEQYLSLVEDILSVHHTIYMHTLFPLSLLQPDIIVEISVRHHLCAQNEWRMNHNKPTRSNKLCNLVSYSNPEV